MEFEKLDKAIKHLRSARIDSLASEDPERTEVWTDHLLSLIHEAELMKKELKAIAKREATYVEEDRWEEMIPWFDLTPEEKIKAIEYWGAE